MRIVIKTTNITLSFALRTFIEEKIGGLEKFLEDILKKIDVFDGRKPRAEAFVEVGKPSRHHQQGKVFYVECQIPLPQKGVRAEAEAKDLRLAINEVKDELQRQLKRYKETRGAEVEKEQRKAKKTFKYSKAIDFNNF